MATAIATANGNFTTAATWATVDATSLLHSETAQTTITTAYVESATFTPGAITIDGIAVKVAGRATTATGTMSVRLAQAAATVAGTEVTINISDIPRANALGTDTANGWIFFKFAAPVLLVAATLYTVSAKTSSASQVALYRDATAANYSRMLRTTTTAALAAGDNWYILGEWTAAATKTNRSVTMDSTATTDYGGASTTIQSFGVGVGGTLTWGTTAATAYILRLSGILIIHTGGTFSMGTDPDSAGTAIPRDSSAELQFDCAADGDFGYAIWGTFITQGLSRTLSKNVVQCLLNTDEAIAQTVLGVDTDTGWLNGDEIAIASTTETATQAETGTLNGAAAATTVTINVAITAAHSGTSPNQAEVILVTRNVRVTAVTITAAWYGQVNAGAVVNCAWTLFRYGGTTAAAVKNAYFYVAGTPTSFTLEFCSMANGESDGVVVTGSNIGLGVTFTVSDCTFYNVGCTSGTTDVVRVTSSAAGSYALTRCGCIFDSNTSSNWSFFDMSSPNVQGMTIDTCRVNSGLGCAVQITQALAVSIPKTITNSVFHCLGGASGNSPLHVVMASTAFNGLYVNNTQFRRNPVSAGSQGGVTLGTGVGDVTFEDCTFVANGNAGIAYAGAQDVRVIDCVFAGDASFSQTAGILLAGGNRAHTGLRFENCTFGVGTAHATNDINQTSYGLGYLELTFVNCNLASATEFEATLIASGASAQSMGRSFIVRQRKDGTTNTHEKKYINYGTVAYDTVTFRTASPSEKLTPTGGSQTYFKLRGSPKRIPVLSGKAITASCYIQKDGTYNGNQPRLLMLANPALGIDADLVLKTMTGGTGAWEQLTGTQTPVAEEDGVVEVVVEVDGTAGNAYVDDWSASST